MARPLQVSPESQSQPEAAMTILCATDFSPCSDTALELAAALARRLGDSLHLLHVVDTTGLQPPDAPMLMARLQESLREAAENDLNRKAEELRQAHLPTEVGVLCGIASQIIVETARALSPRLTVIGTHGRKGPARLFFGSVAQQVVRHAPGPVLVTREDAGGFARRSPDQRPRLAVAADGTPASDASFAWLAAFAATVPCDTTVVRVFQPPREAARYGIDDLEPGGRPGPALMELLERDLRRQIGPTIAGLAPRLRFRAAAHDTAETLVDEMSSLAPDVLVLGVPRGRPQDWTAVKANRVLRDSPLPVLCVPESEPGRDRIPITRSVLVAIDFSDSSRRAIAPAYGLLRAHGGRVELCHVHERGPGGRFPDVPLAPTLDREKRAEMEAQLRSLIPPEAEALGITTGTSVLEGPFAVDTLLQAAERLNTDVSARASRGRSGIERVAMGSVAEEIARRSPRPVLIVHAAD
jgi:nucleotide-binding universal stress UspA family protein